MAKALRPEHGKQSLLRLEKLSKRAVRFTLIDLIEIAIVLGDNPSVSTGGPPMSLGWQQVRRTKMELDQFEKHRPKRKESRREMIVSEKKRTKFFLRNGYKMSEIQEAAAISLNYRNQMTITKLLNPPSIMRDGVKNRFDSERVEKGTKFQFRRHSDDKPLVPRREPDILLQQLDSAVPVSRLRMNRRLSNTGIEGERDARQQREKRFHRRNSPTADATLPSYGEGIPPWPHRPSIVDHILPTDSRTRRLRRNHSSPLETLSRSQALRMPTRKLSPIPSPPPAMNSAEMNLEKNLPDLPIRSPSPNTIQRNLRRYKSAPLSNIEALQQPIRKLSPVPSSDSSPKQEEDLVGKLEHIQVSAPPRPHVDMPPLLADRPESPPITSNLKNSASDDILSPFHTAVSPPQLPTRQVSPPSRISIE